MKNPVEVCLRVLQPGHHHLNTNTLRRAVFNRHQPPPALPSTHPPGEFSVWSSWQNGLHLCFIFSLVCIVLSRLFSPPIPQRQQQLHDWGPDSDLSTSSSWVQWLSCPLPGTAEMKLGRCAVAAGRLLPRLSRCRAS